MKLTKVGNRNLVFSQERDTWDLHIHVMLGRKHTYIIDSGLGSESVKPILEYLESIGNKNPLILINTHSHYDHVWGNHMFENCTIIASELCYERIKESFATDLMKYSEFKEGDVCECLPNMTIDGSVDFKGDGICLFLTTGHTYDGLSIYDYEDKVLHVGDNIGDDSKHIVPDLESDVEDYKTVLQSYMQIPTTHVVGSHYGITNSSVFDEIFKKIST